LAQKVPISIAIGTRQKNACLIRTGRLPRAHAISPPLFCRATALEFKLKEVFSKGVSACFYQHAHETPYSIFGLAGVVRLPSLKL